MVIIDYILGSLFRIIFVCCLFIYHPLQIIAYHLLGERNHQKVVHYLNGSILLGFKVAGNKVRFNCHYELPLDRPIVIIANHQSLWDIVGIYWYFRKFFPVFVSKKELSKGIPSISYNLRKSGSALIDRKDRKQALSSILELSKKYSSEKRAAVIFPEGTRSRDGKIKKFSIGGISALLKHCPTALIVPVAIKNTGLMTAGKYYRINSFKDVSWTVTEPFEAKDLSIEEIVELSHSRIKTSLEENSD